MAAVVVVACWSVAPAGAQEPCADGGCPDRADLGASTSEAAEPLRIELTASAPGIELVLTAPNGTSLIVDPNRAGAVGGTPDDGQSHALFASRAPLPGRYLICVVGGRDQVTRLQVRVTLGERSADREFERVGPFGDSCTATSGGFLFSLALTGRERAATGNVEDSADHLSSEEIVTIAGLATSPAVASSTFGGAATYRRDVDRDGVWDGVDLCPNASESTNGWEDGDGCPDNNDPREMLFHPWRFWVSLGASLVGVRGYSPGTVVSADVGPEFGGSSVDWTFSFSLSHGVRVFGLELGIYLLSGSGRTPFTIGFHVGLSPLVIATSMGQSVKDGFAFEPVVSFWVGGLAAPMNYRIIADYDGVQLFYEGRVGATPLVNLGARLYGTWPSAGQLLGIELLGHVPLSNPSRGVGIEWGFTFAATYAFGELL